MFNINTSRQTTPLCPVFSIDTSRHTTLTQPCVQYKYLKTDDTTLPCVQYRHLKTHDTDWPSLHCRHVTQGTRLAEQPYATLPSNDTLLQVEGCLSFYKQEIYLLGLLRSALSAVRHFPVNMPDPAQIGWEALARSGPDDSCTLACFQTGSVWP